VVVMGRLVDALLSFHLEDAFYSPRVICNSARPTEAHQRGTQHRRSSHAAFGKQDGRIGNALLSCCPFRTTLVEWFH
jgi:hypothetical protein